MESLERTRSSLHGSVESLAELLQCTILIKIFILAITHHRDAQGHGLIDESTLPVELCHYWGQKKVDLTVDLRNG